MDVRLVYVTAPTMAEAESLGRRLVEANLAACANLIPGMRSIYRWQGKIETGEETVLIAKTDRSKVGAVIAAIEEWHSYDVPCALAIPVDEGSEGYKAWLARCLAGRE